MNNKDKEWDIEEYDIRIVGRDKFNEKEWYYQRQERIEQKRAEMDRLKTMQDELRREQLRLQKEQARRRRNRTIFLLSVLVLCIVGIIAELVQSWKYRSDVSNITTENTIKSQSTVKIERSRVNDQDITSYEITHGVPTITDVMPTDSQHVYFATAVEHLPALYVSTNRNFSYKQKSKLRLEPYRGGYCLVNGSRIEIGSSKLPRIAHDAEVNGDTYFFQHVLMVQGAVNEELPKRLGTYRALCMKEGKVFVVESSTTASWFDFADALFDLGYDTAIALGSSENFMGYYDSESGDFQTVYPQAPEELSTARLRGVVIKYLVWE